MGLRDLGGLGGEYLVISVVSAAEHLVISVLSVAEYSVISVDLRG
jgi:hypothetical protein